MTLKPHNFWKTFFCNKPAIIRGIVAVMALVISMCPMDVRICFSDVCGVSAPEEADGCSCCEAEQQLPPTDYAGLQEAHLIANCCLQLHLENLTATLVSPTEGNPLTAHDLVLLAVHSDEHNGAFKANVTASRLACTSSTAPPGAIPALPSIEVLRI